MLTDLLYRLRALLGRRRMEADLDEEVRFHFEQQVAKNVRGGMTEQEALRQARLLFGGIDEVKEECRDARGVSFIESTWQDLRYAARRLRKSPGFTAIAVLSLALGIGANTAIFSLVDAVLLRSLPVENPEELELVRLVKSDAAATHFSYPLYRDIRGNGEMFAGVVARFSRAVSFVAEGRPHRGTVAVVTGNYFPVLGVRPTMGRLLSEEDDQRPGDHAVAVVSFLYWRTAFSEDPTVVGQTIRINDAPYTVVGVAQPGFFGVEVGTSVDAWIPMMQAAGFSGVSTGTSQSVFDAPNLTWLNILARRAPGVDQPQAEAALDVMFRRLHEQNADMPKWQAQYAIDLMPGGQGFSRIRGTFDNPLFVLAVLVGLILALACANLANLLLGRYAARRNEIGVRLALGAGRGRLVRQLLAESLLLGILGGVTGVLFAVWGIAILLGFLPASRIPIAVAAEIDPRALTFAAAVSLASVIVFGMFPAWRGAASVSGSVRGPANVTPAGRLDLRQGLVVVQVALALLLAVGGGLFLQNLRSMAALDLGLNTDNVLTARVDPRNSGYTAERNDAFFRELTTRLRSVAGVEAIGLTTLSLLEGNFYQEGNSPAELADPAERTMMLDVNAEFFAAAGIQIMRGRAFNDGDTETGPKVTVINETAARFHFPDEDALGKPNPMRRNGPIIVGIARDAKLGDVHEDTPSVVYENVAQSGGITSGRTLYIRTRGDAASYTPALRQIVSELDSSLPLYNVKTFAAQKDEALARERLVATLSGFFAALGLLLAAIGIYGVVAYSVVARTREIGVRMSLGAERGDVLWMIQRNALALTALGIAIGIPLSLGLYRLLESQLFGVEPNDALTLAATAGILAATAVAAAWLPARRAASIDPATVLRSE